MRLEIFVALFVLVGLGGFAALNWTILSAPAELNLLVARIEAPPGLLMLAAVACLTVLYLVLTVGVQTAALIESKRYGRELLAQRTLADDAEASRFTALRSYLEAGLAEVKAGSGEAARGVIDRVAQAEEALRREVHEAANGISAYIGELEERVTREGKP